MIANNDALGFLTIIAWPPDMAQEEAVAALAGEAGLDLPSLRMKARQDPPAILGRFPKAVARKAADAVISRGGDAFAPSLADIASLGLTHKISDMTLEAHGLMLKLWRGEPLCIDPADVQIVIRATLSESKSGALPGASQTIGAFLSMPGSGMAYSMGGAYGAAGFFAPYYLGDMDVVVAFASKQISVSNKLDIHTTDGRVFQVDGDKFGFRILGVQRGMSDKVNIDRLCEFFTKLAPNAVVDPYYSLWRPPMGYDRLRLPQMQVNNDHPGFAFYSRWMALLYRHVMGIRESGANS